MNAFYHFCKRVSKPLPDLLCRLAIAHADVIRQHSNKLRIGWFSLAVIHRITENAIDHLHTSARPGCLDRMTDRTLDASSRHTELVCQTRIQALCDRLYILNTLQSHKNGFAQILITIQLCRNTDCQQESGDLPADTCRLIRLRITVDTR